MAEQTWSFDAPTGTYKNHTMSMKLREAAVADTKFMPFVRPEPGYGKKKGESITITRIANIAEPTSAKLLETERIPEDTFSLSTTAITVSEYGRAVPYTSLSEDLSEFDLENFIQRKLRDQLALVLDLESATAFKASNVKYQITGAASSTITTNGVFGGASTDNMNVFHLEEIRDYLYDTLICPMYEGGDYIGIFRTLGLRGVKRDPSWEEWHKYTDPQAKYNGEAGRIEKIRLIEINHSTALGKVGTGSVLGEGVVFGDDAVVIAEALTPELRASIPADAGRSKSVVWYGILAFGSPFGYSVNPGESRIVHVGST